MAIIKIAYQGEKGAYSEEAGLKFFKNKNLKFIPCKKFEEVVKEVEKDNADFGVLPVENTTTGSVTKTYDLLFRSSLKIYGEVIIKIYHCLLSLKNTELKNIKYVYSHPQALSQCEKYITKKKLIPVPEFDTAGSARVIKEKRLKNAACIASKRAAEIYNLRIIEEDIADNPWNYTRFFIISKKAPKKGNKNKTSIVFSTHHRPGALVKCLKAFSDRGINLTKIESRPQQDNPWHYNFYLDFEGHLEDKKVKEAMNELLKNAVFVKILGSYPVE